jgi:hypothetical protein
MTMTENQWELVRDIERDHQKASDILDFVTFAFHGHSREEEPDFDRQERRGVWYVLGTVATEMYDVSESLRSLKESVKEAGDGLTPPQLRNKIDKLKRELTAQELKAGRYDKLVRDGKIRKEDTVEYLTDKALAGDLRTLADHAEKNAGEMERAGNWVAGSKKDEGEEPEE